jgi:CcmD family protein
MKNNWLNRLSRRALLALAAVLLPLLPALAQQSATGPEMADQLRQNGKIYVVVAVIVVIVVGLLLYLISIDRKVSRMERELRD